MEVFLAVSELPKQTKKSMARISISALVHQGGENHEVAVLLVDQT